MDNDSEVTGSGSSWSEPRKASSGRGWIIAGLGLVGIILIAAAVGTAWQSSVRRSDLNERDSHSTTATLLQDAGEQAGAAAALLQQYLESGDDTLIPQIQAQSAAGVESLTEAVAQGDNDGVGQIAADGVGLVEGAGQVIALRQGGDAQGAAAAMAEITPAFLEFNLALDETTAQELDEAAALQSSADTARDLTLWLLVVTGAAGATLGLAATILIARLVMRRRVSKTPSPI